MKFAWYDQASIIPLPIKVKVLLRNRKMNPIVPKPPNSPFFGTNLHGPSNKKLAIPLEAEMSEVANVAKNKGSKSLNPNSDFPVINLGFWPQRQSKICTCGTLSIIGSELYNLIFYYFMKQK